MSAAKPTLDDIHVVVLALSILLMPVSASSIKTNLYDMTRYDKVESWYRDRHQIRRDCLELDVATMYKHTYEKCPSGNILTLAITRDPANDNFLTGDLRLCSLIGLGKLEIAWTENPAEHLLLSKKVLKLYWFGRGDGNVDHTYYLGGLYFFKVRRSSRSRLQMSCTNAYEKCDNRPDVCQSTELESTLRMILGHRTKSEAKEKRRAYASIQSPYWLEVPQEFEKGQTTETPKDPSLGYFMERFPPDGMGGMKAHLSYGTDSSDEAEWQHNFRNYSDFPIYGERIRELRRQCVCLN